jgi:hypothetical protein
MIMAVGPMSPSCDDEYEEDDEDSLDYIKVMMRSCIKSTLTLAKAFASPAECFPNADGQNGQPCIRTHIDDESEDTK